MRWLSGAAACVLVAASMIASACIEKLDISTRLVLRGGLAQVEFSAEASVVAACPCAVDGYLSTVGFVCARDPSGE